MKIDMKESIANINETKNMLFNKIHNIDKPLARLIKGKKHGEDSNQ